MTYRIAQVEYENFGPFFNARMDFSQPGLTAIEGVIEGVLGSDSNGSGKSYLLDGVAWAIFGRCVRPEYQGDDVINLQKKSCAVSVQIVGGDFPIRIERYRQHPQYKNQVRLLIDGKDATRGTNTETDFAITTALGIDFLSFVNSTAFCARDDIRSFFSATDSDRKKILDRLLGLEQYAEAESVARRRLTALVQDLNRLETDIVQIQASIAASQQALESLQGDPDAEQREIDKLSDQVRIKLRTLMVQQLEHEEKQLGYALKTARSLWNTEQAELKTKVREAEEKRVAIRENINRVREDIAAIDSRIEDANTSKKQLKTLTGKKCHTCGQDVNAKKSASLIAELDAKIADLRNQREGAEMQLLFHTGELKAIITPQPDSSLQTEFDRAMQACVDAGKETARARSSLAEVEGRVRGDDMSRTQMTVCQLTEVIEEAKKDEAETLKSIEEKRRDVEALEFWVLGFGNRGLKSFLIEAEIPDINRRATSYARRLLGPGTSVRMSATRELKSSDRIKEELTIQAEIKGCTRKYAGASKGQKKRLDLSLILAFRDIVSRRSTKSFSQLFADEIFDGLDRTGTDFIIEMLREIGGDCPVTLITHSSGLKKVADRVITVYHSEGQAVLRGDIPSEVRVVRNGARRLTR